MRNTSKTELFIITGALFAILVPSIASAAVKTEFCVLPSKTHGGTDSKGVYVNLKSASGASTGDLNLDNAGVDDFRVGHWSCFGFQESDLAGGRDIGFHTTAVVSIKSDQDDFCVEHMYSRRYLNGKVISGSEYLHKNSGREICFGDYNNKSKKSRTLRTYSRTPTAKIRKVKTEWNEIIRHNGPISQSVSVGSTRTNGSTKTKEWNLAVTVAAEAEAGAPGNSLKVSTAVTASAGGSSAISQSVSASKEKKITVGCPNQDRVVTVLYQKTVRVQHSDGTPDVAIPLQEFSCVKA